MEVPYEEQDLIYYRFKTEPKTFFDVWYYWRDIIRNPFWDYRFNAHSNMQVRHIRCDGLPWAYYKTLKATDFPSHTERNNDPAILRSECMRGRIAFMKHLLHADKDVLDPCTKIDDGTRQYVYILDENVPDQKEFYSYDGDSTGDDYFQYFNMLMTLVGIQCRYYEDADVKQTESEVKLLRIELEKKLLKSAQWLIKQGSTLIKQYDYTSSDASTPVTIFISINRAEGIPGPSTSPVVRLLFEDVVQGAEAFELSTLPWSMFRETASGENVTALHCVSLIDWWIRNVGTDQVERRYAWMEQRWNYHVNSTLPAERKSLYTTTLFRHWTSILPFIVKGCPSSCFGQCTEPGDTSNEIYELRCGRFLPYISRKLARNDDLKDDLRKSCCSAILLANVYRVYHGNVDNTRHLNNVICEMISPLYAEMSYTYEAAEEVKEQLKDIEDEENVKEQLKDIEDEENWKVLDDLKKKLRESASSFADSTLHGSELSVPLSTLAMFESNVSDEFKDDLMSKIIYDLWVYDVIDDKMLPNGMKEVDLLYINTLRDLEAGVSPDPATTSFEIEDGTDLEAGVSPDPATTSFEIEDGTSKRTGNTALELRYPNERKYENLYGPTPESDAAGTPYQKWLEVFKMWWPELGTGLDVEELHEFQYFQLANDQLTGHSAERAFGLLKPILTDKFPKHKFDKFKWKVETTDLGGHRARTLQTKEFDTAQYAGFDEKKSLYMLLFGSFWFTVVNNSYLDKVDNYMYKSDPPNELSEVTRQEPNAFQSWALYLVDVATLLYHKRQQREEYERQQREEEDNRLQLKRSLDQMKGASSTPYGINTSSLLHVTRASSVAEATTLMDQALQRLLALHPVG